MFFIGPVDPRAASSVCEARESSQNTRALSLRDVRIER